jgi:uncharacterized phage protein gp47/JayE
MYRNQVKDIILERMLEKVGVQFDKREGSIIWDALAPAAVEFQNFFYALAAILDEVFPDTATRKYLIKHCAERGITPYKASKATVEGVFTPITVDVLGQRFSHEDLNYIVTKKIKDGIYEFKDGETIHQVEGSFYELECETEGSVANGQTGRLIPISYIKGLETANITSMIIPGEDEESTEALRARYFESLNSEAFGGNKKDYRDKVLSFEGVDGCKIYSGKDWNGGGTVKVVVQPADLTMLDNPNALDKFIANIQKELDPDMNADMDAGSGDGIAPIGHFVTVVPLNKEIINITFSLEYELGYSWDKLGVTITNSIKDYINELNRAWQDREEIIVRIARLESAILDIQGVKDVWGTTIEGQPSNYKSNKDAIIELGVINGN